MRIIKQKPKKKKKERCRRPFLLLSGDRKGGKLGLLCAHNGTQATYSYNIPIISDSES